MHYKHIHKTYNDHVVLPNMNITIYRDNRIDIIGPNNANKTTLLKMITKELETTNNSIKINHNIKPNYYTQHHTKLLHPKNTIFNKTSQINHKLNQTHIQNILNNFLFSNNNINKLINILNNNKQTHISLAKLLLNPNNLLLLDEPTNHLDLENYKNLIKTLNTYNNTIIFINHNHNLIQQLTNKI